MLKELSTIARFINNGINQPGEAIETLVNEYMNNQIRLLQMLQLHELFQRSDTIMVPPTPFQSWILHNITLSLQSLEDNKATPFAPIKMNLLLLMDTMAQSVTVCSSTDLVQLWRFYWLFPDHPIAEAILPLFKTYLPFFDSSLYTSFLQLALQSDWLLNVPNRRPLHLSAIWTSGLSFAICGRRRTTSLSAWSCRFPSPPSPTTWMLFRCFTVDAPGLARARVLPRSLRGERRVGRHVEAASATRPADSDGSRTLSADGSPSDPVHRGCSRGFVGQ